MKKILILFVALLLGASINDVNAQNYGAYKAKTKDKPFGYGWEENYKESNKKIRAQLKAHNNSKASKDAAKAAKESLAEYMDFVDNNAKAVEKKTKRTQRKTQLKKLVKRSSIIRKSKNKCDKGKRMMNGVCKKVYSYGVPRKY